ncbi:MAG: hypothetical protein QOD80_1700, partial [Verrucomicrobiota bacterium]
MPRHSEVFYETARSSSRDIQQMFAFFSNRLGCLGSLFVSVIGTIILLVLLR